MNELWKKLRTNWMYWRFRHITRNRLRLQAWWAHRRPRAGARPSMTAQRFGQTNAYRPRGSATNVYPSSYRRAWAHLLGMVLALTALSAWATSTIISPALVYGMGALVVVGSVYLALRGV